MTQHRSSQNKGIKFIRLKKVVTLIELTSHLNCSPRTVQRRLVAWGAINSFNGNGRYYTLSDIPEFDANGLWRYQGAFFSRFGNLPKTFVQLVANSEAGLTAAEAGALLGLRPSSFLWHFRDHPVVKREKHQGVYVYFASSPISYAAQKQQRNLIETTVKLPAAFEAVAILVEKIKHPALSEEALSRRLRKQNLFVEPATIHNLFVHHELTVKKTPHSI